MRKKVLQIFLVVTLGLIALSLSFSQTLSFSTQQGASTDLMMLKSFGLGLIAIAGMFISLVLGVSLIPQEIERRTIYTILAKPVKRYEFIIGKLLGAILTLAINIGLMGLVFVLTVMIKAWGAEQPAATVTSELGRQMAQPSTKIQVFDANTILGIVMIYLQFVVLSSVVILFSVFLTPTVNFFMGAGVYAVGIMASVTETLSTTKEANALVTGLYKVIHAVIPNFDKFNITNQLVHPESQAGNIWKYTGDVALYALLYALVMATLAVIIFERKEV
jgi:ABC-type transport system involved in multi-copper enzyme maturation permease subunit